MRSLAYDVSDKVKLAVDTYVILHNRGYDLIPKGTILEVVGSTDPGTYLVRVPKKRGVFPVWEEELEFVFSYAYEEGHI